MRQHEVGSNGLTAFLSYTPCDLNALGADLITFSRQKDLSVFMIIIDLF